MSKSSALSCHRNLGAKSEGEPSTVWVESEREGEAGRIREMKWDRSEDADEADKTVPIPFFMWAIFIPSPPFFFHFHPLSEIESERENRSKNERSLRVRDEYVVHVLSSTPSFLGVLLPMQYFLQLLISPSYLLQLLSYCCWKLRRRIIAKVLEMFCLILAFLYPCASLAFSYFVAFHPSFFPFICEWWYHSGLELSVSISISSTSVTPSSSFYIFSPSIASFSLNILDTTTECGTPSST